ncbi:hypothetical protein [Paenibacillus camerounensis]|nr:hypothetical protein [Paenibacillus camerounensis]
MDQEQPAGPDVSRQAVSFQTGKVLKKKRENLKKSHTNPGTGILQ